jgi:hypothetical protein
MGVSVLQRSKATRAHMVKQHTMQTTSTRRLMH